MTAGIQWITTGETLPIRTVAVKGAPDGRADEIRSYANIRMGAPLLGVDLDGVSRRVREHPFVSAVAVRRVPPDTVEIEVLARKPVAMISAGSLYLVDDAGVPFKRARPGDGLNYPVISGDVFEAVFEDEEGPTDAAENAAASEKDSEKAAIVEAAALQHERENVAQKLPIDLASVRLALLGVDAVGRVAGVTETLGILEEVHLERGFGLTLVFSTRVRARVGNAFLDTKVARLVRVVRKLRMAGHDPAEVYLDDGRRPERIAVRLRPASEVTSDPGI